MNSVNWLLEVENQQTRLLGKENGEVEYLKVLNKSVGGPSDVAREI